MNALLFLWELPQNILGLTLWACTRKRIRSVKQVQGRFFLHAPFGVSLGHFVFWCGYGDEGERIRRHEYGHTFQSRLMGPFYLLLVGLPSVSRGVYSLFHRTRTGRYWQGYYRGYPERWADELAAEHAEEV